MKYKLLIAALVASLGLVACNDSSTTTPASEAPATDAPASDTAKAALPQACEDYFKKVEDFIASTPNLPDAAKDSFKSDMDQVRSAIATTPESAQISSCQQAASAFDQGIAAYKQ